MKLHIEKMIYGGAGLARPIEPEASGKEVLVPFTLPDEIVDGRLVDSNRPAEATVVELLSASPFRVQPGCVHFGECGGCHYQHANYPAQIKIKTRILRDILERAGLAGLPAVKAHTAEPWNYRNRSRFRLEAADGRSRVGYNRRGSKAFLPVHECPISASLIWRACEALLEIAGDDSPAGRWVQSASEVEFFVSPDQRKLQMTIFVKKNQPGFHACCDQMQALIPELAGAGAALLPPESKQRQASKVRPLAAWGAAGMTYRVADEEYWITRGGFFQVNRFLLDRLVSLVTTGRAGQVAWDLYAGAGLFSRVLARTFPHVVAVEAAGGDLVNTFRGPGRRAVEGTTTEFLRGAVLQRERPDLVVVDPPRAGLGDEVSSLLSRVSPAVIVYVSCDPMTLSRDLKSLTGAGYSIPELHMVDLFPQTFHMETVVVLRK